MNRPPAMEPQARAEPPRRAARSADEVLARGIAAGLLPAGTQLPQSPEQPWPVQLLTALGAWLVALPLLGVLGTAFGGLIVEGVGAHGLGAALIVAAVLWLRQGPGDGGFVEQLAVPVLLAGVLLLGYGLMRDLPIGPALGLLFGLSLLLAGWLPPGWLTRLCGLGGFTAAGIAVLESQAHADWTLPIDTAWWVLQGQGVLAIALLMAAGRARAPLPALRSAPAFGGYLHGWAAAALLGSMLWSGQAFLLGGIGGAFGWMGSPAGSGAAVGDASIGRGAVSALLALWAAWELARRWASLRQPAALGLGGVVLALALALPALGLVLALGTAARLRGRALLASGAATAAIWIVSAFYYRLEWSLLHKSLGLLAAAAVLAASAALWRRSAAVQADGTPDGPGPGAAADNPADAAAGPGPAAAPARASFRRRLAPLFAALPALLIANLGIQRYEALIAEGRPVFVELAPVDPRSLMQGDYMRLAFRLPSLDLLSPAEGFGARRPLLAGPVDARGVLTLARPVGRDEALAPGELRVELTPALGAWTLVSDAWFFAEGDATRWEAARYGEFRVMPDGRALLVGMADAALQAIPPTPPAGGVAPARKEAEAETLESGTPEAAAPGADTTTAPR